MNIKEEIRNKSTFNIDELIQRLKKDFCIRNKGMDQLEFSLFDTLNIILNTTNRKKIPIGLYSTWYRMTKDYWYLNNYNKTVHNDNSTANQTNSQSKKIKSISIGDTTTTFVDEESQINVNGVTYSTGTIDFSEDVLVEKYKRDLYKYRKMRW